MSRRKGFSQFLRMAEQNKESFITVSIVLYALVYLVFGLGGMSFQTQPAIGYVQSTSNSNCPQGSVWIEGNDLHWCDGSTEYYATNEGGDPITKVGSVSGPAGSIWIEGNSFHWIDSGQVEYYYDGVSEGSSPGTSYAGSVWVENGYIHYVDANGDERTISD